MSISDRIKLRREKRLRESRESLAEKTGIVFSQEITAEKAGFPVLKYLINSLILFCADFGSLYCVISAFHIELSTGPLAVTCAVFSLILSFMYVRQRLKVITYLAVFAGFLVVIFRYYTLVNSGVNALWNSIILYTDSMTKLPYLREFTVYYSDTYTAMSAAVCVIAVGLMILQNIVVSEKMSLRGLFFFTFPIAQLGMFFGFPCSKAGMFLVAVSWVLVEVVFLSGGYYGLTDKFTVFSSIKKHRHSYGFLTDARNTSTIAVIWLGFLIAVTALVFTVVPDENFEVNLPVRDIKTESRRAAKNFMSYGFSAVFSQEREANAPGKLANVSSISFDGRTDLEVELVNYRVDRMYLRSFSGYYYDSHTMRWYNPPESTDTDDTFDITYRLLEKDFLTEQNLTKSRHKIGVRAVDPKVASNGLNVPYFTTLRNLDSVTYNGPGSAASPDGGLGEIIYYDVFTVDEEGSYDLLSSDSVREDKQFEFKASSLFLGMKADAENALTVPERNLPAIEQFCEEYGIKQSDSDYSKIQKVLGAFRNDYEYTLRPGKVPQDEDYVNYFLSASKKGYCQHFATAATLVLRYLGIPARYAEGYAVDREDFYSSDPVVVENFDEWVTSPYRIDTNVSRVLIPDSNGHAWVEIFRDGFGWDPLEVTIAVSRNENRSLLGNLLSRGQAGESRGAAELVERMNMSATGQRLLMLALIILALLFAFYLFKMMMKAVPRHLSFVRGDGKEIIRRRYGHLYDTYLYSNSGSGICSYREFFEIFARESADSAASVCGDAGDFRVKLEKALFAGENAGKSETDEIAKTLDLCRKSIVRSMPLLKKFRYFFVDFMW